VLNDVMIVNNEFEKMRKEVVLDYFKVLRARKTCYYDNKGLKNKNIENVCKVWKISESQKSISNIIQQVKYPERHRKDGRLNFLI